MSVEGRSKHKNEKRGIGQQWQPAHLNKKVPVLNKTRDQGNQKNQIEPSINCYRAKVRNVTFIHNGQKSIKGIEATYNEDAVPRHG
jgi:hypothetical protein